MNYHVAHNGQQSSGLTQLDIRSKLQSGELSPNDLCWTDGMAEWKPIGVVFTAATATASPAPNFPPMPTSAVNPYAPPQAVLQPLQALNAPLAGLGQRLGAAMLDGLVGIVAALPIFIGIIMTDASGRSEPPPALMAIGGLLIVALMIYNMVLLSTEGQTIGKRILGIRICNYQDDGKPGFVKAVLLRIFVNGILGFIPLYGLIDICCIFGQERRCIHDVIAGTRVVKC